MIPQKPKVESPASIAKNMISSFILAGLFTSLEFINLITRGFTKLSAMVDIIMTEYTNIKIPPFKFPLAIS